MCWLASASSRWGRMIPRNMVKVGILPSECDATVELIEGKIVVMAPIGRTLTFDGTDWLPICSGYGYLLGRSPAMVRLGRVSIYPRATVTPGIQPEACSD